MRSGQSVFKLWLLLFGVIFLLCGFIANGAGHQEVREGPVSSRKVFLFIAKKLGIPILRGSIEITQGSLENGKPIYRIQASIDSIRSPGFLFRMNNRFTSTIEGETCFPIRYVKEINQGGFLIRDKNYVQTLAFDFAHKRVIVERPERKEREEIPVPSDTYDPLSMFARCYLKEEIHPGKDIQMSIYDGLKLRQMIFHVKKERVQSELFGEVEAVRLESATSFSAFGDKEGIIRIWYTTDGKKTPLVMELDLPIGSLKFELEEVREN